MPTQDKLLYYIFNRHHPRVQRAEGYWFYDTEGRAYLDATSGAYNCVLGHTMPERVARVMREQTQRYSFASLAHFENDAALRLADRLLSLAPDYAAVGLYQSGADAVEATLRAALQVARTRHGPARRKIIGRRGAYHGLTLGAQALGGSEQVSGFLQLDPQDCFGCPYGLRYPSCEVRCASALQDLVEREGPETIAALVGVPSTSGGPVPDEYWPRVREICDRYGILLVSDEVLEGMWRTGPLVALHRWGVTPDLVATGKALGAGFVPIFAMLVSEGVRDALAQSDRFWGGHTYTGHVLSCEIALAVLDELEERGLMDPSPVERGLQRVMGRLCERVPGSVTAGMGAMSRLRLPCAVPGDPRDFYLETQALLRASGLVVWVDDVQPGYVELGFGPPYIADDRFFEELESRMVAFLERLFAQARSPS